MDSKDNTFGIEAGLRAIAQAILAKTASFDAGNGWRGINHGSSIQYFKDVHYGTAWTASAGQTNILNTLLPTGVTDFRNCNPQVTLSTPNAAVMLGGYIGGATPDFGTLSIYTYNPTGGGIVCAYWHVFMQLTVYI